ncbi:S8 family serine peptidase [Pseudoflavitalea rhizosphaerae]|uniref:S8 family serine peptidase n=1 Tax=Pseudoflavitalea rhizosphaerae TaxID=1884793 RepID=UPI000F8D9B10|nr:S8 family serine peptidase [Pseudoflavitalea rhizosphaerae]
MKRLTSLLTAFLLAQLFAFSQERQTDLRMRTAVFSDEQNLQAARLSPGQRQQMQFRNRNYVLLRFSRLPGFQQKQELLRKGVKLFDYIPGNGFFAELPAELELTALKPFAVNGVFFADGSVKISPSLELKTMGPDEAVAVHYAADLSREDVLQNLLDAGAKLRDYPVQPDNTIFVLVDTAALHRIARIPFVTYVYAQSLKDIPLNYLSRSSNNISSLAASSGRNLQGKGVMLGIGDQGDPTHLDFTGRLVNNNAAIASGHATHTQGTMAGAGLLNPKYKGMAPRAGIVAEYFSDILVRTPQYISQYGMVLTNNSYHSSTPGCDGTGTYDALSNYLDAQTVNNPSLLHVFAAGNDGSLTCGIYPPSYATVRAGFQSSKNALVVGQYNNSNDLIGGGSSRGPVKDGRLKPEIMAGGIDVLSCGQNNTYLAISGTSMSAPAVTGSLALLYERYRQLHGGANPSGALIKALACNGADDMGNPGPDFLWGFGRLNARTSIEMLEQDQFFTGSVTNGSSSTHTILSLPAGASQLKVMLYWVDPAASPIATTALVNNLDLTVTGADAVTHRPLILNPDPAHVTEDAAEGTDNLNNIEQVVINTPPAGNVNITINGTNIPSGPQQYVVVYQVLQPEVHVDYPAGGETMVPGEAEQIRWSAYDNSNNSFTIEYSADNGANWELIDNNVPADVRFYNWTAPPVAARQALIRVTRNTVGTTATSERSFTVLGQPVITLTKACPKYIQANWNPVVDADSYEILMLSGDSMQVVGNTNANTYLLEGLSQDSTYWIAVRARINGVPGRPSVAASLQPNAGSCGTGFNNDLTIETLLLPVSGREFTASQPAAQPLRIRVRNRGAVAISATSYELGYQINGGTPVTLNNTTNIGANGFITFNFTPVIAFNIPGDYLIKTWVKLAADPYNMNDTLQTLIRHLPNPPITLAPDFVESFEAATLQTYLKKTFGLDGLPRADFGLTTTNGRGRITAGGFARTGNNALLLDQSRYRTPSNTDSVTLTFNLSQYSSSDQIWLDFFYRNQGIDINYPNNKVWIRGNDNAAWVPVFTLPATVDEIGFYKAAPSVNITEALANASPSQTISSSFQVRLGQQGITSFNTISPDNTFEDGISYDDIKLTRPGNDVGVRAILNPPVPAVCTPGPAEIVTVEVKNYSNIAHSNVEVAYELNGTVVKEFINLAANELLQHQFAVPVDLSAFQQYTIRAWVHMAGDDFVNNDSLESFSFTTAPEINSFPYLQDFETNDGYWYPGGINSSWQWGHPSKTILNRAANGNNAWFTGLSTPYNNSEYSYLYSPCINLTGMVQPVLSFSHIFRIEETCDCDNHWVEYSTDGMNWKKMGAFNQGTNWYNHSGFQTFIRPMPNWHVASLNLPVTSGRILLRFVLKTDAGTNYDGIGIDDIHIFDKAAVYTGADIPAGTTQPVSGNDWVHFSVGNNRIVSINPQGQDLGSTTVKVFRNTGAIRNSSQQYYLDRNIVINSATAPISNVLVRFYFTDTEAKALVNATNCATCTKPEDPYLIGITQYSGNVSEENGTLADNTSGLYQFIPPSQVIVVPYDNGYYAEYAVNHFSEFWISGGGPGQNVPLPVTLSAFTATRRNNTGLLQWQTSQELNSKQFTIEKSTDGELFIPIGTVPAAGNSQSLLNYQFSDPVLSNGMNYYRLLITDINEHSERSVIRSIQASDAGLNIQVFPNPVVNGPLFIRSSEEIRRIEFSDISGRMLLQRNTSGTQYKLNLQQFAKGTYLLSLYTAGSKKTQRIVLGE